MAWVALVGPELEENLSLRYLASSLQQAGFSSEILAYNGERHFGFVLRTILEAPEPPLLVGLSMAFQWRAEDFLALALALREGGYTGHITAGGHFATFACEELLRDFPELDSICRQEAEITIVELAQALSNQKPLDEIEGLGVRDASGKAKLIGHARLPDLAKIPWPDRRGEPAQCFAHGIAPLVGSRGCYANCSFCCIAAWHEQSLPGTRYRLRDVNDIADEMLALKRERGVDIFVFHDDNFFVPGHRRNAERFNALADALEARDIGRFATVVKARPTDADPEVFRVLQERLHCIRIYVGIESDSEQGLKTLRRWAHSKQNHEALALVRELDLYTCFNLLLFDPDTTVESLRTNINFLQEAADLPFNFGRVELYAGTPLLHRMRLEKRAYGDYLRWDYDLSSPEVERVFTMSMDAFRQRNFGEDALANRMMGLRFDVEVCRHFHPDKLPAGLREEAINLTKALSHDSVKALDAILSHVEGGKPESSDAAFVRSIAPSLRAKEATLNAQLKSIAATLQRSIGQGKPLSEVGDAATPAAATDATIIAARHPRANNMIGILQKKDTKVTPQNPEYSRLFEFLREHKQRTEPLEEISSASLAECSALLIGEPHDYFEDEELDALRTWVKQGGNLLILSAMGGDAPSERGDSSNIYELFSGVSLMDNLVGVAPQHTGDNVPFRTQVDVDISAMIKHPEAILSYDTGCTISILSPLLPNVTHALAASPGAVILEEMRLDNRGEGDFTDISLASLDDYIFARIKYGRGAAIFFGGGWSFKDDALARRSNLRFLQWLLPLWVTRMVTDEAKDRMLRPQRHRLLHGYPMAPLMPSLSMDESRELRKHAFIDRDLIVGVLPHPFCNPAVKGCGFCTFPHEVFSTPKAAAVTNGVVLELENFVKHYPEFHKLPTKALYIGGGTANLTPPESFRALCQKLSSTFDLKDAEITLEGVPAYFVVRKPHLLEILKETIPARSYRISMGIQTFDERQLKRMGRTAFGGPDTFAEVAGLAHSLGYSVSGDLLFNLPGQTLEQMKQDIKQALDLGLDHVCLYHLVMFDGLGTEWSNDRALLATLPPNDSACENWLELRQMLLEKNFTQTTLTNFEGKKAGTSERFLYEESVLSPEKFDWLGFGPSAISLLTKKNMVSAYKLVNPESSEEYMARSTTGTWAKCFDYTTHDVKILYLTRKIALLGVDRREYFNLFHADPLSDFREELSVLIELGLLTESSDHLKLTPRGMFYSDTISGLLAWRQINYRRVYDQIKHIPPKQQPAPTYRGVRNDATYHRMG